MLKTHSSLVVNCDSKNPGMFALFVPRKQNIPSKCDKGIHWKLNLHVSGFRFCFVCLPACYTINSVPKFPILALKVMFLSQSRKGSWTYPLGPDRVTRALQAEGGGEGISLVLSNWNTYCSLVLISVEPTVTMMITTASIHWSLTEARIVQSTLCGLTHLIVTSHLCEVGVMIISTF